MHLWMMTNYIVSWEFDVCVLVSWEFDVCVFVFGKEIHYMRLDTGKKVTDQSF